jgi:hypothetical protein
MAHEIAGFTSRCEQHGQFVDGGAGCPVCAGLSSGKTWSTERGNEIARRDPDQPYAPELDAAWNGET